MGDKREAHLTPLPPRTIMVGLMLIAVLLACLGHVAHVLLFHQEAPGIWGEIQESYVRLFRVDGEANIPTWFSTALLLASSFLLASIARRTTHTQHPHARQWWLLAMVFLYLSLDEAALIHEMAIKPIHLLTGMDFAYPWVIPALFAILLLYFFIKDLFNALPHTTKLQFIVAALVFISGAIGFECLGALFLEGGIESPASMVMESLEELAEMIGIIIFIGALMAYQ